MQKVYCRTDSIIWNPTYCDKRANLCTIPEPTHDATCSLKNFSKGSQCHLLKISSRILIKLLNMNQNDKGCLINTSRKCLQRFFFLPLLLHKCWNFSESKLHCFILSSIDHSRRKWPKNEITRYMSSCNKGSDPKTRGRRLRETRRWITTMAIHTSQRS